MSENTLPIIIIGAGLTGLIAARELEKAGYRCLIVDKDSKVGGKIQTDLFQDQYLLDHGFQVLLPAYPDLKALISELKLPICSFSSGAILNVCGKTYKIADPLKHPLDLISTAISQYATTKDKLLILKLKSEVSKKTPEDLISNSKGTSLDFLAEYGFSQKMLENFWTPFFSGIFLEKDMQTDSGFLLFLYKMFSESPVAVPAQGLGQLTKYLRDNLLRTEILLNSEVESFDDKNVVLKNGKKIQGQHVVSTQIESNKWGCVTTLYYSSPETPIHGPWLYLNSQKNNYLTNHIAVMTEVSAEYSRNGKSLISVNVIKKDITNTDFKKISSEISEMFGPKTRHWEFLKSYSIEKALPLFLQKNDLLENTPSQQGSIMRGVRLARKAIVSLSGRES